MLNLVGVVKPAREAEFRVKVEPHYKRDPEAPEGKDMKEHAFRPDSIYTGIRGRFAIDVSVTHPCANSYVRAAAKTPLSAASRREQEKQNKAADWLQYQGGPAAMRFYPFVLETHGAVSEQAERVLKVIAQQAAELHLVDDASFYVNQMATQLSITLQRSNAKCYAIGLLHARHASAGVAERDAVRNADGRPRRGRRVVAARRA